MDPERDDYADPPIIMTTGQRVAWFFFVMFSLLAILYLSFLGLQRIA